MSASPRRIASLREAFNPELIHTEIVVAVRFMGTKGISVGSVNGTMVNCIKELAVQDPERTEMPVLEVVGNRETRMIDEACNTSQEVELVAEVVLEDERYHLRFIACNPIQKALQLLGASELESVNAAALATEKGAGILTYIFDLMCDLLGIVNLESGTPLSQALMATILQAVSFGKINGTPARIFNLLIGPPGIGKGLVSRAARLHGPVSEDIAGNSVSTPGLIGWCECQGSRMKFYPGALSCASGGVAILEDDQNVDNQSFRHVFGILSEGMESGRVRRTNVGLLDIGIDTALLVDVNPKSTVRPAYVNKDVLFLNDIGLPVNFLSRVDCVFHFNRNVARQMTTMANMLASIASVGPEEVLEANPKVRELRVLIAYMRDKCPTIQLGGVTELIQKRVAELFERNEAKLQELDLASDFILRTGKAILKLLAASTRIHGASNATERDVDLAFNLVQSKLDFIAKIEPSNDSVANWKHGADDQQKRQSRIVEHFAGKDVGIKDVAAIFQDQSRKTVVRDLHGLGASPNGKGNWLIPNRVSKE